MSEHLPECRVRTYTTDDGMVYEVAGDLCICPALRACEQRKDEEWFHEMRKHGRFAKGYAAGVQAARDAVAGVQIGGDHFWSVGFRDGITVACSAIDALRGES